MSEATTETTERGELRPLLIRDEDAARLCGVGKTAWRQWVESGAIAPVVLPTRTARRLFRLADVEALVAGLDRDHAD